MDSQDTFYAKSLMTPEDVPISSDALDAFFNYLTADAASDTAWLVMVDTFGGSGSAIDSVASTDTAYANRGKLLTFQLYASSSSYAPPYPSDGTTFVDGMVSSILDNMSPDWNYAA